MLARLHLARERLTLQNGKVQALRTTNDPRRRVAALIAGAVIGMLGGLIGLGGAEFRLPLLITVFAFVALEAVIVNKAIGLIVVASALVFRTRSIPVEILLQHWPIVTNLLAGSLVGAWLGADWATRLAATTLYRVISILLVLMAILLALVHDPSGPTQPIAHGAALVVLGAIAGLVIGIIAAVLGVAGGEFLIPTLVLLFGADIKVAGSLSLAVSLPTMLAGFARYSRDRSFGVLRSHRGLVITMAVGSILGTYIGSRLLVTVPSSLLAPILAVILVVSAIKVWRHR